METAFFFEETFAYADIVLVQQFFFRPSSALIQSSLLGLLQQENPLFGEDVLLDRPQRRHKPSAYRFSHDFTTSKSSDGHAGRFQINSTSRRALTFPWRDTSPEGPGRKTIILGQGGTRFIQRN